MRALAMALLMAVAVPTAAEPSDAKTSPFAAVEFMLGHWRGEGFGGSIEEIWLPAEGDAMHGVFRNTVDGRMRFSEFLQLTVEDEGLVLRFEHFRPDYTTWEGDGPPMELRLAGATKNYARFEGMNDVTPAFMEYRRQGRTMTVVVAGIDGVIVFQRVGD